MSWVLCGHANKLPFDTLEAIRHIGAEAGRCFRGNAGVRIPGSQGKRM